MIEGKIRKLKERKRKERNRQEKKWKVRMSKENGPFSTQYDASDWDVILVDVHLSIIRLRKNPHGVERRDKM
ncbi:hypothetical protein JTE90_026656 [Oedothorax gibbosus]|uniref:Uncharacterized protein n=1 Tax=Oedothorax gibbosus TaxID=931172 RepID=A0AAV6TX67_9ARAC|nr:hypothetical protein JTE90_026656 [Oedothorax gibbosus]